MKFITSEFSSPVLASIPEAIPNNGMNIASPKPSNNPTNKFTKI